MDSKKEIQHVYLVGAKSLGAYGGYETFVYKLTEYHQNGMNKEYPMSKGLWTSSALGVAAYADEIKLFIHKVPKKIFCCSDFFNCMYISLYYNKVST